MKTYTLTLGKGKNKREWRLSYNEFREFEFRFGERELIDLNSSEWSWLKESYPSLVEVGTER